MELKEIVKKCIKGDKITSSICQKGGLSPLEFYGIEVMVFRTTMGYEHSFNIVQVLADDWEFYEEKATQDRPLSELELLTKACRYVLDEACRAIKNNYARPELEITMGEFKEVLGKALKEPEEKCEACEHALQIEGDTFNDRDDRFVRAMQFLLKKAHTCKEEGE